MGTLFYSIPAMRLLNKGSDWDIIYTNETLIARLSMDSKASSLRIGVIKRTGRIKGIEKRLHRNAREQSADELLKQASSALAVHRTWNTFCHRDPTGLANSMRVSV